MDEPVDLSVLPSGYQRLLGAARRRLEPDDRVRALWLGGSLARGVADAASDLDLVVAVADDALPELSRTWRRWLADITPTVLAEELPFATGSFYSVTPDFERLDVVLEAVSTLASTAVRSRVTVFDKDGVSAHVPAPEEGAGPSAGAVTRLVTEYFRISAVETILVRDDWLLAREHLHVVGSLIYRLFVEANAPLPPMGVKQWKAKLTGPQQAVLAGLPTTVTDLDGLRAAHLALATAFVTNAEVLARRLAVAWPDALEAAAGAHLSRHLGVAVPHPRGGPVVVA